MLYVVLLFNLGAIVAASRVLGPLVVVPQVLLATNFSFALTRSLLDRMVFAGLGLVAVLGPLGLERFGIWHGSYVFDAEGLHVVPNALHLPAVPTLVLITLITIANLVSSTLFCGAVRAELERSEARSELQTWHLERLLRTGFDSLQQNVLATTPLACQRIGDDAGDNVRHAGLLLAGRS